jgi:NAD(P)-dependent dehydrogenase (short-subunit alcohol dehydrogenase family)
MRLFDLTGKVALVTGGNGGIGLGMAQGMASCGASIVIAGRNADKAGPALASLRELGARCAFIAGDVTKKAACVKLVVDTVAEFGRLDILVNNAGIAALGRDGAPSTADIEAVRATIETNFIGALAVTQAMLPLLRKSKSASIVNVSSELGSITGHTTPEWKFAHVRAIGYSASKAAMNMMTAQLALELAGTAIKVNSVNPGYTATDLNKHSGPQTVQEGAAETIRLALAGPDGPTGGFYETGGTLPW